MVKAVCAQDPVMDDNSKRFYAKVEKYGGWQAVPAERIHSIFIEVSKPADMGFVLAKRGYWARQINADTFQIIKLVALKGAAYGLSYGLSLSYVPYPFVPKLRWHRTLKSVSLDLREQAQVHLVDSPHISGGTEDLVASISLGEKCFREEMEKVWAFCASRISDWFDSTRTLDGILAKCDEHLNKNQSGIQYIPGARLVRAFTYAKIGRLNDAKMQLDIFLDEYHEGAEARTNLYAALDRVSPK